MTEAQRQHRFTVILCFGLVYLFWGSTYLGISIAVEQIPPALMCATRFLVAGILMLAYLRITGHNIVYTPRQLWRMAVVGTLLLMGGNLTLSYAEQIVPSGLAALVVASTPLWFLVLDSLLLGDHHISNRGKIGLSLGILGLAVLMWPEFQAGYRARELWWSLGLLGGSFSWALGSVLSKRWHSADVDQFSSTAWQIIFAGISNGIFALLFENIRHVAWSAKGLGAILYLVICGSWIGYTAYIWLLRHVPTSKVSTYAYVNPVVAVFLGWLIAHEPVDRYILMGSAIVVASVILVTSAKVKTNTAAEELPAAETT
ncbi:MAG TPA: EamA family transporter [Terriglobales bacterium]|nr:EamA family transporter [Terriglobales bacterium]